MTGRKSRVYSKSAAVLGDRRHGAFAPTTSVGADAVLALYRLPKPKTCRGFMQSSMEGLQEIISGFSKLILANAAPEVALKLQPALLDRNQAAEYLGVSLTTFKKNRANWGLKPVKVAGMPRYRLKDLERAASRFSYGVDD